MTSGEAEFTLNSWSKEEMFKQNEGAEKEEDNVNKRRQRRPLN